MPRIPFEQDELDDETTVSAAEQARIARRDHDATAAGRALMQTGAAKQLKAMTEARSYKGIPKVAKAKSRPAVAPRQPDRARARGRGR